MKLIFFLGRRKFFRLYDLFAILWLSFFVNKLSTLVGTSMTNPISLWTVAQYSFGFTTIVAFYLLYHLYIEYYDDAYSPSPSEKTGEERRFETIQQDIRKFIVHYSCLAFFFCLFIASLLLS